MAKLDLFISILLTNEAGLARKYYGLPFDQQFEKAKLTGWANDKDDKGGATMCGVTLACFKLFFPNSTKDDLKAIDYATWYMIVKSKFWDRWKADEIKGQQIANFVVDWTFNSGIWGIKIPQELAGTFPDGVVGQKTIDAVNSKNQNDFLKALKERRIAFFKNILQHNPSQEKFLNGWINRVNMFN